MFKISLFLFLILMTSNSFAAVEIAGNGAYTSKDGASIGEGSAWQGVAFIGGKYEVIRTVASVIPLELEEGEMGLHVKFEPEVKFATRGLNLKEGQSIPSVILNEPLVVDPSENPKDISFGSVKAKISATMSLSKSEFIKRRKLFNGTNPNYRIVITAGNDVVNFAPPITDMKLHYIYWIGDINGDGFPDVLMKPGKESNYNKVLLISNRKGKKIEMQKIGAIPGTDGYAH